MNQNNQPALITETIDIQAGEMSNFVNVNLELGPNDQFNIWGFFCYIEPGDSNLGDIDNDANDELSYTDIDTMYLPSRGAGSVALPLCGNPRIGMGESLYMQVWLSNKQAFHGNSIPLAAFNNAYMDEVCPVQGHSKLLPFREALAVYPSEQFKIRIDNTNPATPDIDTYSRVHLTFIGEVVDKDVALEMLLGRFENEEEEQE